jgi:RNA polymerase sigma-70 factor (sigma-E family)
VRKSTFAAERPDASGVLSESALGLSTLADAESEFDASFVEQYPTLYRAAHKIAYRLLADREDAEDIAQEACFRAHQRWDVLTDGNYAAAWVAHVSTNLSLDRWRRRRCARRYLASSQLPPGVVNAERVDLNRALGSLPRRQREVVLLRYVADLPENEVARKLSCSPGTVKTHASRGLAALRAALGDNSDA